MVQDVAGEFKVTAGGAADWGARAAFALRMHVLERAAGALRARSLTRTAAVVKGGALALEGYATPWARDMDDLDLLVLPSRRDDVLSALGDAGFRDARPAAGRERSRAHFAETVLEFREGPLSFSVEVHTSLDRLAPRPVDLDAILARAHELPGLAPLLAPEPLDHALLVALHLANHEFQHEPGWADLALLLRAAVADRGADEVAARLGDRARAWRLGTALGVALGALRARGVDLPDALRPLERLPALRRAALLPFYRPGRADVARHPARRGWSWAVFQAPLRDDPGPWSASLARFWLTRLRER